MDIIKTSNQNLMFANLLKQKKQLFTDEEYYDNLGEFIKLNQNLNIHFDDPGVGAKDAGHRELAISASTEVFFAEEKYNTSMRKESEPPDLTHSTLSQIAPVSRLTLFQQKVAKIEQAMEEDSATEEADESE